MFTLSVAVHDTSLKDPHLGLAIQRRSFSGSIQPTACCRIFLCVPSSPCYLARCYVGLYGCGTSYTLQWSRAA